MHPFSILTLGIFVAGYITARWDLIAQLYAVTVFAWDHGVVVSSNNSVPQEQAFETDMGTTRLELPKALLSSRSSFSSSSYQLIVWLLGKQNW